jgi:hypothetical protein
MSARSLRAGARSRNPERRTIILFVATFLKFPSLRTEHDRLANPPSMILTAALLEVEV